MYASHFFATFAGLGRAHGHYRLPKKSVADGEKLQGSGETIREPPSLELWERHLAGEYGLGIIPITDEATVRFGAIDVDVYDLDIERLEREVQALKLPLVPCRTKSGGCHLFLFCSEDVPASLVRGKLMDWAVVLGYSGVEIFPKQTRLANQNDIGNWINMPYFGGDASDRKALMDGEWLTMFEFLIYAQELAVSTKELEKIEPPMDEALAKQFDEAPPCLQSLARNGFEQGNRNRALFNVAVYLRKRFGDDFEHHVDAYNAEYMDPPLGHQEVATVIRNVKKKTYEYLCNEPPIVAVCNRQICLTRKFGVGTGDNDPGVTFGKLVKVLTEPPTWIWDVDGERLELTTTELKDQHRFHTRCMDILNKWPNAIRPKDWATLVRQKLEAITEEDIIPAPPDATQEGMVWTYFANYCSTRSMALSKEELLLHKPWAEDGMVYFSGPDFKRYLDTQRVHIDEKKLWNLFRKAGAGHHFFKIKGRGLNVWSIEQPKLQDESFDIPENLSEQEML